MSTSTAESKGRISTLLASLLHFDLSFTVWVLLGSLGIYIGESLGLSPGEKGLMVAAPILSGSLLRVPVGLLNDRFGGKRVGAALLAFLILPLAIGWQAGNSLPVLLGVGLLLGTAGASFAVALPLVSRWYPSGRQGLVMGVVALGNSGTVVANLFSPWLADRLGWNNVLGLAILPIVLVLAAYLLMAKEPSDRATGKPLKEYLAALRQRDLWGLSLLYGITFGGFVGLSSFLPIFLHHEYRLSPAAAGYLTALAALVGSFTRPLGGYLADRFGGRRVLSATLIGIGAFYALASQSVPLMEFVAITIAGMAFLGMGSGAVFQLVPQRFPLEIGVATGVVGSIGGLGGFFLPNILGGFQQISGSFSSGMLALAAIAFGALVLPRAAPAFKDSLLRAWPVSKKAEAVIRLAPPQGRILMVPYLST